MNKTYSILFIGNSYTYTENLPEIFGKLAESAGYTVEVTAITKGSYTLAKMADPNDPYGSKVEKALTGTQKFDYVILQEQSLRPAGEEVGEFYAAVRNLVKRIRESGATPLLYATWGRANGNSKLTQYGWTNESMTWRLAAAYAAIGEELDVQVAHVGLAFYDVYTNQSTVDLYNADKSHPSYAGSYLAAATLCTKLFRITAPDVANYIGNVTPRQAVLLRQAAIKAVWETPPIPIEFQTNSKGVGE